MVLAFDEGEFRRDCAMGSGCHFWACEGISCGDDAYIVTMFFFFISWDYFDAVAGVSRRLEGSGTAWNTGG